MDFFFFRGKKRPMTTVHAPGSLVKLIFTGRWEEVWILCAFSLTKNKLFSAPALQQLLPVVKNGFDSLYSPIVGFLVQLQLSEYAGIEILRLHQIQLMLLWCVSLLGEQRKKLAVLMFKFLEFGLDKNCMAVWKVWPWPTFGWILACSY